MSEWNFMVLQPAGYGLDLSFHPGASVDDVRASMVLNKAKEPLSEDTLKKLRELQAEIDQFGKMLVYMPATTFQEKLQRTKPEVQLATLNIQKELYLETPREQIAKELALKACKHYRKWLNNQLADLKASLLQAKHASISSYFKKEVGDPRYLGHSFSDWVPADGRKKAVMSVQDIL